MSLNSCSWRASPHSGIHGMPVRRCYPGVVRPCFQTPPSAADALVPRVGGSMIAVGCGEGRGTAREPGLHFRTTPPTFSSRKMWSCRMIGSVSVYLGSPTSEAGAPGCFSLQNWRICAANREELTASRGRRRSSSLLLSSLELSDTQVYEP